MRSFSMILAFFATLASSAHAQDATKPDQWQQFLGLIVADIERAVKTGDRDLYARRKDRPGDYLSSARNLPENHDVRDFCRIAAGAAVQYVTSIQVGGVNAAREDLKNFRSYHALCRKSIAKLGTPEVETTWPTKKRDRESRPVLKVKADKFAYAFNKVAKDASTRQELWDGECAWRKSSFVVCAYPGAGLRADVLLSYDDLFVDQFQIYIDKKEAVSSATNLAEALAVTLRLTAPNASVSTIRRIAETLLRESQSGRTDGMYHLDGVHWTLISDHRDHYEIIVTSY